jgi:tetratricopeptide (TPR) repeat protein
MELVHHGEAALERGAVRTAEHDFEQALSLSPHLARAETGLGYVALERSEPSAAISHFKPAASAGHAEALIGLGDAYRRLGRTRAALEAYQKYLKQFPGGSRTSIAQRQIELLQEQVQQAGP